MDDVTAFEVRDRDALRTEPIVHVNEPTTAASHIAHLPDELLLQVLASISGVPDVALVAAVSHLFYRLGKSEVLWAMVCHAAWPDLPARVVHEARGPNGWRHLAKTRTNIPRSQERCGLMDEAEKLVSSSSNMSNDACERLAGLLIAIFVEKAPKQPRSLAQSLGALDWFAAMARSLETSETVFRSLEAWGRALVASLDDLYEDMDPSLDANLRRRKAVVAAKRGASALAFLWQDLLLCDDSPTVDGPAGSGWFSAAAKVRKRWLVDDASLPGSGLFTVFKDVVDAMQNLEAEGFNMATPSHLRPSGLPRSHIWWGAPSPVRYRDC